jgi:hypothetical protein
MCKSEVFGRFERSQEVSAQQIIDRFIGLNELFGEIDPLLIVFISDMMSGNFSDDSIIEVIHDDSFSEFLSFIYY